MFSIESRAHSVPIFFINRKQSYDYQSAKLQACVFKYASVNNDRYLHL